MFTATVSFLLEDSQPLNSASGDWRGLFASEE
jgi:hypothetical protein